MTTPTEAPSLPATKRLLIVDDEPKVCECLKLFFMTKGFETSCAQTGADAVERLMGDQPDLVLLDIGLPDFSGLEVLKRARELAPYAKVYMVTAHTDENSEVEAKVYGAMGYITKPFDFSDVTWAPVFADPN
jgi:DNA-binding response OmpR family regulator